VPLRCPLATVTVDMPELGTASAAAEATLFDFAAVSVALRFPFRLPRSGLTRLAAWLAEPAPLVQAARLALQPLFERLLPAIHRPQWQDDLSEEYMVFHVPATPPLPTPGQLLTQEAGWLARLVRLETAALSQQEIEEALRLHLSYSPDDLVILDWAAALVVDSDCDETLEVIEFGNLQLLEFRHIDNRLEESLAAAYRLVSFRGRLWLPFLLTPARSLRALGGLKVEADGLFERAENVLKLVGDQYLARVFRLLGKRFHLDEWEQNIQRKLDVGEGVYQVLSDQAATYRTEALEAIVIALILLELLLAVFRH
jgi:hypothetical protein